MNSKSKRPSSPVFFLDRCLGHKEIAADLRNAGVRVETHDAHFPQDAKDETWLAEVGKRKWVVLTQDRHIRYRATERQALMRAGVPAFVLTARNLNGKEIAGAFLAALPAMTHFVAKHPPPFIAKVTRSGAVSALWQPPR